MRKVVLRVLFLIVLLLSLLLPVLPALPAQAGTSDAEFTIVVFPDIQNEVSQIGTTWATMYNWIVTNKTAKNIVAVVGVGDNVDVTANLTQWANAQTGWSAIKSAGIPYVPVMGNHDYDNITIRDITTWNSYFGASYFSGKSWFAGTYNGTTDNYYVNLTIGTQNFLIFSIEAFPRQAVLTWLKNICLANASSLAIVSTHSYLSENSTLYLHDFIYGYEATGLTSATATDGADDWAVFKTIPNVRLVLSGHEPSAPYTSILTTNNDGGFACNQYRIDYQLVGQGHLAVMKFRPRLGKVGITAYSPYLDAYTTQYSIDYTSDISWWNAAWDYRAVLSFNGSALTGSLTNYPVKVHLTSTNFDFTKVKSDLSDIRFVDADDVTVLNTENASYNSVAKTADFWVSANITASSNYSDYIYMYYGNAAATALWNTNAVWTSANATGVWHLDSTTNNGTTIYDSTIGAHNGTLTGTTWSSSGRVFDGASYIDVGADIVGANQSFTAIAWAYRNNSGDYTGIVSEDINPNRDWDLIAYTASNLRVRTWSYNGTANSFDTPNGSAPSSTWIQTGIIVSNPLQTCYYVVGGIKTQALTSLGGLKDDGANLRIGMFHSAPYSYNGTISEVRIYNIVYDDTQTKADDMNMTNSLLYFGGTDPTPTTSTSSASAITMDKNGVTSVTLNGSLTSLGGAPSVNAWFDYGTTVAYGSVTANTTYASTSNISVTLPTGLTPGATYHYRFRGSNVIGTANGSDVTFTFTMPTLTTSAASSVYMDGVGTYATLNGNISSMGTANSTYTLFQWGYNNSYGNTTTEVTQSSTGAITSAIITAYNPDSTIHYRAAVRNGAVYAYGSDQTFSVGTSSTSSPIYTYYTFMQNAYMILFLAIVIIVLFMTFRTTLGMTGLEFVVISALMLTIAIYFMAAIQSGLSAWW